MAIRTFDELWELYKPRRVKGKKSESETIRLYDVHVRPALGPRLVVKTSFEHLDKFHQDMKDTPYQANRVLSLLRPMFKYAQALAWVPPDFNPARHVRMFPERKRRRHMRTGEAPLIANCIRQRELIAPDACAFLWLIIFTGARPGEIKAAKWANLKGNRLTLWEHKSKTYCGTEKIIVLPPLALEKLAMIPRGHPSQKIIRIATPEYVWRKIRKKAKCPDLRIYDLRHTFGTYALEHGYTLDQIGESLGHANPATTKIYAEMNIRSRQKIALDASMAIFKDMNVRDVVEQDAFD